MNKVHFKGQRTIDAIIQWCAIFQIITIIGMLTGTHLINPILGVLVGIIGVALGFIYVTFWVLYR